VAVKKDKLTKFKAFPFSHSSLSVSMPIYSLPKFLNLIFLQGI